MKEKFTLENVILSIYHDTRKPKHDNLFPVKYRINHMQKQYYYLSGIDLTVEDFEKISKAKVGELKELREIILAGFDRIKEIIKNLVKSGNFSMDQLQVRLKGGMKNSVLSAFFNKAEALKKNGKIGM